MRILVLKTGEYGQRHIDNMKTHAPKGPRLHGSRPGRPGRGLSPAGRPGAPDNARRHGERWSLWRIGVRPVGLTGCRASWGRNPRRRIP